MKDSFIFYRSFYESAKDILSDKDRLKLYEMIFELGLNNLETDEQNKMIRGVFKLIEPQIKANNKRYENGKKGGAPVGNTNAKTTEKQPMVEQKSNRKTTEKQPNNNVNENDNVNVNVNENVINNISATVLNKKNIEAEEIIARLNELAGTNFRAEGKATKKLIDELLKDYTKEEVLYVVEKMCYIWGQTKQSDKDMSVYLRPSTLFRKSNFENYLGMKVPERKITTGDLGKCFDFSEFRR